MKKFIIKVVTAILLIMLIVGGITYVTLNFIAPQYSGKYLASILDKVERLKSIDEPKIILVGTSSVAFGFDSAMIEQEIGMPVVNLGLNGCLDNSFHENMAKYNINAGDIIVVSHDTYKDSGVIGYYDMAWITIENHYEVWNLITPENWKGMICAFPDYMMNAFVLWITGEGNKETDDCYARSALNEYGDVIYPRNVNEFVWSPSACSIPKINDICANRLNEFNEYCKARGATLLIAGCPIGYGEYNQPVEVYEQAWEEIKDAMDCEVISDVKDYLMDYKYFYNTAHHLTNEGARIRTEQFIEDLKNWQEK